MIETQFKVLMYLGQYVEPDLLRNGIYTTSKPFLYDKDYTIDSLVEMVNDVPLMISTDFATEWCKNLRKCELVDVSILIK